MSQIQEALDRAEASQGNATVYVSGSDVGEIQEALNRLPGYTGREGPSGYYIEHRDDTFVVYLAVEQ
ncbi:hypothetical protein NDI76_04830 [Halogeometricum sp. S1BR25-6]|uniref:Uncharacterized protein n=1 Tax=Halogeometricum salsisoli TaxID=2950536 RepID=A0ABU2GD21_9EURY|nr:hypothetical protein [Halogeometricum sp. S1BR25-6]MDS0298059.1 hypothetical protein [Halogeometricum sp. S1BR25-6]